MSRAACCLIPLVCLLGCGDRYEAVTTDTSVYRLDKKTGQMAILRDGELALLPPHLSGEEQAKLAEPMDCGEKYRSYWYRFGERPEKLRMKATLVTSWQDGVVYYKFYRTSQADSSYHSRLDDHLDVYSGEVSIVLYDPDGFQIATFSFREDMPTHSPETAVTGPGRATGAFPTSAAIYRRFAANDPHALLRTNWSWSLVR